MISESANSLYDTSRFVRRALGAACSRNMSGDPESNLNRAREFQKKMNLPIRIGVGVVDDGDEESELVSFSRCSR